MLPSGRLAGMLPRPDPKERGFVVDLDQLAGLLPRQARAHALSRLTFEVIDYALRRLARLLARPSGYEQKLALLLAGLRSRKSLLPPNLARSMWKRPTLAGMLPQRKLPHEIDLVGLHCPTSVESRW